jgi:hypothetical protein
MHLFVVIEHFADLIEFNDLEEVEDHEKLYADPINNHIPQVFPDILYGNTLPEPNKRMLFELEDYLSKNRAEIQYNVVRFYSVQRSARTPNEKYFLEKYLNWGILIYDDEHAVTLKMKFPLL